MSIVVPLAVMLLAVALARLESGLLDTPPGVVPTRPDTAALPEREHARAVAEAPRLRRDLVGAGAR